MSFTQGFLGTEDVSAARRNNILAYVDQYYVNLAMLTARFRRVPVGTPDFDVLTYRSRPDTGALGADVVAATAPGVAGTITLDLSTASYVQNGDILELSSGEHVEIIADPNLSTGVINVRRRVAGSPTNGITYSTSAATARVYLMGNSRTGAEVDQTAYNSVPTRITSPCQTFQFASQVGGSVNSTDLILPAGIATPFQGDKQNKLIDMLNAFENQILYGRAEGVGSQYNATNGNSRRKHPGLRQIIDPANVTTNPANGSAYKPIDLTRDLMEKVAARGGKPNLMVVSTNFITGFQTWGMPLVRIVNPQTGGPYTTPLGVEIEAFVAPFMDGLPVIKHPKLRPFSACVLDTREIAIRNKRDPFWQERGKRGDAFEGDWIAEHGLQVDFPEHHAWVEGFTVFAPTS